jgi:hypothetical protein
LERRKRGVDDRARGGTCIWTGGGEKREGVRRGSDFHQLTRGGGAPASR